MWYNFPWITELTSGEARIPTWPVWIQSLLLSTLVSCYFFPSLPDNSGSRPQSPAQVDGGLKCWKNFRFREELISLVINACKKQLFQELKIWPTLTPGDHKRFHLCHSGGLRAIKMVSEPLFSRVGHPLSRTQIKTTAQVTDERMQQLFIWLTFFPWIPIPLPTLFFSF